MKQKVLFLIAALFGIISAMAQGNIYVATKGGAAYTFPIETLDSIAFAIPQGARIIDPQQTIDSLNAEIAKCGGIDTYEYVDLGLPSGTLWATHNIGATKPEEYGAYFAWGEPKSRDCIIRDSIWFYFSCDSLKIKGVTDSSENLTAGFDAATVTLGDGWRMPTYEEIYELVELENVYAEINGVKGRKFIGKNGKTLFFPFAGYVYECCYYDAYGRGEFGYYWSATNGNGISVSPYGTYDATILEIEMDVKTNSPSTADTRYYGYPIRPVKKIK